MDLSNNIVLHIKKQNQEYLQFKKLLKYSDIITHAYSLGIDKNYRTYKANKTPLENEIYIENLKNYQTLCEANELNYQNIYKASQAHTDNIKIVKKIDSNEKISETTEKTDGLITNQKDIILSTTNADCILLLFFDPIKKVIANVHSGWRGTIQEISVKTIEKMKKEYDCNPKDIIVCICPSIRKCHFEVEADVKEMFEKEFSDLTNEFITEKIKNQKWNIDTVLINKIILEKAGLKSENIIDSGICSVCNSDKIHSYRAEGKEYGLNTALIEMV